MGQYVMLTGYPQKVPNGKKWTLPTKQEILIEVNSGTLTSFTLCNSRILSNPRIITGIIEGQYGQPNEVYSILFKDLHKVAYTNDLTYRILPLSIVDTKFNLSKFENTTLESVGLKQLVFYSGQFVYVSECIQSMQIIETDMTAKDYNDIKKKENERKAKELGIEQKRKASEEKEKEIAKIETRKKILFTSDFFESSELTNIREIKLQIQEKALKYFYDYTQQFKLQYPDKYKEKVKEYNQRAKNGNYDNNSIFDFSLDFDKFGKLKKVSVNNEENYSQQLDTTLINRISPLITLNHHAIIKLDGIDYNVNSKFFTHFNFTESYSFSYFQIEVTKKGEISIIARDGNPKDDELLKLLYESRKSYGLKKRKYSITIKENRLTLVLTHFQDFNEKENVIFLKQVYNIEKSEKI
jgi:hypothetical protein